MITVCSSLLIAAAQTKKPGVAVEPRTGRGGGYNERQDSGRDGGRDGRDRGVFSLLLLLSTSSHLRVQIVRHLEIATESGTARTTARETALTATTATRAAIAATTARKGVAMATDR